MPHNRYYHPQNLITGQTLLLEGEERRHLKVMRAAEGEKVELVNGKGQLARATVARLTHRSAELIVKEVREEERRPKLILAQALPRAGRLDLILEKGTELGATDFWLFPGERSEKGALSPKQLERGQRIVIAAMKQSGRLDLPKIEVRPPLKDWDSFPRSGLFGDIRSSAPLLKNALPHTQELIFFVGPESGLTQQEITLLEAAGIQGVRLHDLILRTDTAPLVALSLLSHLVALSLLCICSQGVAPFLGNTGCKSLILT